MGKAHGCGVDILISNAGYGKRIRDVWDIPLEEFGYTINVNLRASFLLVRGVVEGTKTKKRVAPSLCLPSLLMGRASTARVSRTIVHWDCSPRVRRSCPSVYAKGS